MATKSNPFKKATDKGKQQQDAVVKGDDPVSAVQTVSESVQGAVKEVEKAIQKTGAQRGLPDGWTRFTVTAPIELAEDMKDLAYTKRVKLKDVIVDAFQNELKLYTDTGEQLLHRPERKQ